MGGNQSLESSFEEMGPREERTWQEARGRPAEPATLTQPGHPRPEARELPESRMGLRGLGWGGVSRVRLPTAKVHSESLPRLQISFSRKPPGINPFSEALQQGHS